ncbi:MAG: efflux RND transporter permease subunit, partial [Treponema sp.]|nr:efflux RND transporter permease subunit [Treponema sp.]
SVAAGWFYAQFCLPALFCFFMSRARTSEKTQSTRSRGSCGSWLKKIETSSRRSEKLYRSLLKKVLRNPVPLIGVSLFASLLGLLVLISRPAEFIAPDTVSEIEVTVDFPFGTTPEGAAEQGIEISRVLSRLPGLSSFYGRMGAETDDTSRRADPDYRRERLVFRCFLEKPGEGEHVIEGVREALNDFKTPIINAALAGDRTAALLGLSSAFTLALKGTTPEETSALAEKTAARLQGEAASSPGFSLRPSGTRPQLRLVPRREVCASLGVSVSDIAGLVYAATEGIVTGIMEIEGRPLDIRVSGTIQGDDPLLLKNLPLPVSFAPGQNTGPVFLGTLVDIEWVEAETALARQDRSDVIYLDIFPSAGKEKKIPAFLDGMGSAISRADESVFVRYRAALAATVILVLLLLYLTLGAQFESFLLPLILMLAVPFSLAGAGPALFLSGASLDSGSVLGLVALFGLAVNNGIVLFEISAEKIRRGLSPQAAVYSGALERFRPVLLTTLTTVFALLPLVVSPLGNSQAAMASTMLGGIIVSGFLAFFALPPVFVRYLCFKRRHHD